MIEDKRHIQLRLSSKLHQELEALAMKYEISIAELVRGIIFVGIPVFDTLTELRFELVTRLVKILKKEARLDKSKY